MLRLTDWNSIQINMLGNMHINKLDNMHVNLLGNMLGNMLDNIHVNILGTMLGNMMICKKLSEFCGEIRAKMLHTSAATSLPSRRSHQWSPTLFFIYFCFFVKLCGMFSLPMRNKKVYICMLTRWIICMLTCWVTCKLTCWVTLCKTHEPDIRKYLWFLCVV